MIRVESTKPTTSGGKTWAAREIICWSNPGCFPKNHDATDNEISKIGKKDKNSADQAAVNAMREELNKLIPENPNQSYDVFEVIETIIDTKFFLIII